MDDEEDLKKITALIDNHQSSCQTNFQLEFEDFISFGPSSKDDVNDEENIDDTNEDITALSINNEPTETSKTYTLFDSLKSDERKIIELCGDDASTLRQLMILNRTKYMHLIQVYKKVKDLLLECKANLRMKTFCYVQEFNHLNTGDSLTFTPTWKLAAPYFKDKDVFASPYNADVLTKRHSNELSIFALTTPPKWTDAECNALKMEVQRNYNRNRIADVEKQICDQAAKATDDAKALFVELLPRLDQLIKVGDQAVPPLGSDQFIDWYSVAQHSLNDKYSALRCKTFWHIYLHPHINKQNWSVQENKTIKKLAAKYSYQNWEAIAAALNTKRTAFTICVHYFSHLSDRFRKGQFTAKEDELLLDIIECKKIGTYIPWQKVVYYFEDRSRQQLYNRYKYYLSQRHVTLGKFSEAEDILLMILVDKFGKNFNICSTYMPHRSPAQLKSRYNINLKCEIKKGTFTVPDDEQILDHVACYGEKNWGRLSVEMKRGRAQVRQRYQFIKQFLALNPDKRTCEVPKRKHEYRLKYNILKLVADQYKQVEFVPTINMIEECLEMKTEFNSSIEDSVKFDSLITNYLRSNKSNEIKSNQNNININMLDCKNNVIALVDMLGATLNNLSENLNDNNNLDETDMEILKILGNHKPNNNKPLLNKLIPPSIGTLQGLNYLLNQHHNNIFDFAVDSNDGIQEESLSSCDDDDVDMTKRDKDLFLKRFAILFKWSSFLSLEKPSHQDDSSSKLVPEVHPLDVEESRIKYHQNNKDELLLLKKFPQSRKRKLSSVENVTKIINDDEPLSALLVKKKIGKKISSSSSLTTPIKVIKEEREEKKSKIFISDSTSDKIRNRNGNILLSPSKVTTDNNLQEIILDKSSSDKNNLLSVDNKNSDDLIRKIEEVAGSSNFEENLENDVELLNEILIYDQKIFSL